MFDVAKWFQRTCKCLVFLPIRDTTYDHHRNQPPLDTVIKDLIFRIDAPLFMDVLYKRVKLALSYMNSDGNDSLFYELPNGIRVQYPQSEQGFYLACILRSLFQNDALFRRLIAGIAGTDIRSGLEIFLDFCKSGHIQEDEIFKIRHSKGDYILPKHIVTRVLFRGNRRYYHDANAKVKNIFTSYPEDIQPDPFARLAILSWLKRHYRIKGENGTLGFHKAETLTADLVIYGHDERRIANEIKSLIKAGCILPESQDINKFELADLISIAPSGHVHLDLITNLDYLATCAEDVWFENSILAQGIADRLVGKIGAGHLSYLSSIENSSMLLSYLEQYKEKYLSIPNSILPFDKIIDYIELNDSKEFIERLKEKTDHSNEYHALEKKYPAGTIVDCQITGIKNYGVFVEFGIHGSGLIHVSHFNEINDAGTLIFEDLDTGDQLQAEILGFKQDHGRFNLKPVLPEKGL
jgi:hypothetical protein